MTQMNDEAKTERCVVCGADTGVLVAKPISERQNYVEGAGQLCGPCARSMRQRQQMTRDAEDAGWGY
jgi:hypothetical protein